MESQKGLCHLAAGRIVDTDEEYFVFFVGHVGLFLYRYITMNVFKKKGMAGSGAF